MKKLCIGITTWNNLDNIEQIKRLYFNNLGFKVYIVDDLSDDGLLSAFDTLEIKYKRVPYKIGAPGKSRNMILDQAKADGYEFITFCDGDDYFDLDSLAIICDKLTSDIDFAYSLMVTDRGVVKQIANGSNFTEAGVFTISELLKKNMSKVVFTGSGGRIYNLNTVFANNIYYNDDLPGQDTLFNTEMKAVINKVLIERENPFYYRYIVEDSLSNSSSYKGLEKRLRTINKLLKYENQELNFKRITGRFIEVNNTRGLDDVTKLKALDILFDGYLDKLEYLTLFEKLKSLIEYKNEVAPRRDLNFKKELELGLTIIVIGSDNFTQLQKNKYLASRLSKVQILYADNFAAQKINQIFQHVKYSKLMFVKGKYDLSQSRFDLLVDDCLSNNSSDMFVPILDGGDSIRDGKYKNLFIKENLIRLSGNIFDLSIYDTAQVLELGLHSLGDGLFTSHEFVLNYIFKLNNNIKLLPKYQITAKYSNSSPQIAEVAKVVLSKNEMICLQSLSEVEPRLIDAKNQFVYENQFDYKLVCASSLNPNQISYLNYQISNLEYALFDGVYFTNEIGEVAGIAYFKQVNFNTDRFVRIDVSYQRVAHNKLIDIIDINQVCCDLPIEGEFDFDQVINQPFDLQLLNKYIEQCPVKTSLKPGLCLISLDSELNDSIKPLVTNDNIQILYADKTRLLDVNKLFNQIKYNRTQFISSGTNFADLDIDHYLKLTTEAETDFLINTIQLKKLMYPSNLLNPINVVMQRNLRLENLNFDSRLLNFNISRAQYEDPSSLLYQYLVLNNKFAQVPFMGIKFEHNETVSLKISIPDEQLLLDCNQQRKIRYIQNIARSAFQYDLAQVDEGRVNQWVIPFVMEPTKIKYLEYLMSQINRAWYDGVIIINKKQEVINCLNFKHTDKVNWNKHMIIRRNIDNRTVIGSLKK